MNNMEYKIITGTPESVGVKVTEALNDGWGLIGQPYVFCGHTAQAVIKDLRHEPKCETLEEWKGENIG